MNTIVIKKTVQFMIIICMLASLFLEPVIVDWFKWYIIKLPVNWIIFSLLGSLLLITTFFE